MYIKSMWGRKEMTETNFTEPLSCPFERKKKQKRVHTPDRKAFEPYKTFKLYTVACTVSVMLQFVKDV